MEAKKNNNKKSIIMLIIFLFIGVILTTIVYVNQMKSFIPDDEGAIDIVDKDETDTDKNDKDNNSSHKNDKDYTFVAKPGFEVSDKNGVWKTETDIAIFKVSYVDGEGQVSIMSDDGDKVIAPGSENSYIFKLRNLGNVPMDYTLDVDAYVTPGDITIPVEYRLSRDDGKWISGNSEEWVDTTAFNEANDEFTLGTNRFLWYTLDWKWLFENDNDELDTYLGNLAVDGDIILTIKLNTEATISKGFGGGHIVATGDNNKTLLYAVTGGMAFIVFLFVLYKKDEDEE